MKLISIITDPSCHLLMSLFGRLSTFFNKHNVFMKAQFGFCNDRFTSLAIIHLYEEIFELHNNNLAVCGAFLDFAKAFYSVNH